MSYIIIIIIIIIINDIQHTLSLMRCMYVQYYTSRLVI